MVALLERNLKLLRDQQAKEQAKLDQLMAALVAREPNNENDRVPVFTGNRVILPVGDSK